MILTRLHTGEPVTVGDQLGRGGEGTVYRACDSSGVSSAAKIYKKGPDDKKLSKLKVMVSLEPAITKRTGPGVIAWPKSLLVDQSGTVVGIEMPLILGALSFALLEHADERMKANLEMIGFSRLVKIGRDAAALVAALHDIDVTVGDINYNNFLIDVQHRVCLIDVDTVAFSFQGVNYECNVKFPEFSAPERLRGDNATKASDVFSIAILMFRLLFQAVHPFVGRFVDPPHCQLETIPDTIQYGQRPSEVQGSRVVLPPRAEVLLARSFQMNVLGEEIKSLMDAALDVTASSRPSALEIVESLERYHENLVICRANSNHAYFAGDVCPWCSIRGQYNFFPKQDVLVSNLGTAFLQEIKARRLSVRGGTARFPQPNGALDGIWNAAIQQRRDRRG